VFRSMRQVGLLNTVMCSCSGFFLAFAVQGAVAFRDNHVYGFAKYKPMLGDTFVCQLVNKMVKSTAFPEVDHRPHPGLFPYPQVDHFLSSRGLVEDYNELLETIKSVPSKWHGGVKGSDLARAILLGEYENAFEAKSTRLTLLRSKHHIGWSEFRLCISDVGTFLPASATELPFKRYRDGGKVKWGCRWSESEYKRFTAGVAGIEYKKGLSFETPVEVQRLLMKTSAVALQKEFEDHLRSIPPKRKGLFGDVEEEAAWAALVTRAYRERFFQHGLRVYFMEKIIKCCCWEHTFDNCLDLCPPTHRIHTHTYRWFEYVDLAVQPNYVPPLQKGLDNYDKAYLNHLIRCSDPGAKMRTWFNSSTAQLTSYSGRCSRVMGAFSTSSGVPDCKCPHGQEVYCKATRIAGRKFDLPEIKCEDPYCSDKPCPHGVS